MLTIRTSMIQHGHIHVAAGLQPANLPCCIPYHALQAIGEPIMEVEMHPGDVLYLPRGTVHQATAQSADSCHLTLSTYQRWTYGDLLSHMLQAAIVQGGAGGNGEQLDDALSLPLSLRKGLPLGHLFGVGLKVGGWGYGSGTHAFLGCTMQCSWQEQCD